MHLSMDAANCDHDPCGVVYRFADHLSTCITPEIGKKDGKTICNIIHDSRLAQFPDGKKQGTDIVIRVEGESGFLILTVMD